jgi:DNA-binding response OmpR family regulator
MQSRKENTNVTSRLESRSRRLMAVDDEADITLTLKKELEQSGFSLDVFNDLKCLNTRQQRIISRIQMQHALNPPLTIFNILLAMMLDTMNAAGVSK